MNVLVIEDNDQNLYLVRFLLESRQHRMEEARNGPDGIARAIERPPDVVLLDIQLPLMDGYEVARRLRALRTMDAIPIVAVTSYAMSGDRQKALEAGCDAYVEKPIDPDTFADQVEAVVAAGRKADGSRA